MQDRNRRQTKDGEDTIFQCCGLGSFPNSFRTHFPTLGQPPQPLSFPYRGCFCRLLIPSTKIARDKRQSKVVFEMMPFARLEQRLNINPKEKAPSRDAKIHRIWWRPFWKLAVLRRGQPLGIAGRDVFSI